MKNRNSKETLTYNPKETYGIYDAKIMPEKCNTQRANCNHEDSQCSTYRFFLIDILR